jgi:small subunit ribosomal protein S16
MLAIKLQRIGKKHQPSYRLVVAESRSKMAAPPVEDLGAYSSFTKTSTFNKERIAHWIKMGAQPTVSVHNLLIEKGLLTAPKVAVKMKKAVKAEAAAPVAAVAPEQAPAAEEKTTEAAQA